MTSSAHTPQNSLYALHSIGGLHSEQVSLSTCTGSTRAGQQGVERASTTTKHYRGTQQRVGAIGRFSGAPALTFPLNPRQYLHSAPVWPLGSASSPGLGGYLLLFGCFRDQLFGWKTPKLAVDLLRRPFPCLLSLPRRLFYADSRPYGLPPTLSPPPAHFLEGF